MLRGMVQDRVPVVPLPRPRGTRPPATTRGRRSRARPVILSSWVLVAALWGTFGSAEGVRAEDEDPPPPRELPAGEPGAGAPLRRVPQAALPPPEVRVLRGAEPEAPPPAGEHPAEVEDASEGEEAWDEGETPEDEAWEDEAAEDEAWEDEALGELWEDEEAWEEEEEETGRSFLYKEFVLSAFYAARGIRGLPVGDMTRDHFGASPRPPGTYVGLDYVQTFGPSSGVNEILPDWLPLTAIDLHPRLVFNPMEELDGFGVVDFAPQDFWAQFSPGNVDRLSLRIGQFVIPYGVNPILAPRQRFILPIEAVDLGLKWDWGIDLRGPIDEYDWEVAATIGSGEGLHSPHLFDDSDRTSWLLTGRIGAPTYWDFQYGFSFLYGDLPVIRGPLELSPFSISRWRIGLDSFYRHGTYLMASAQLTYGQDGHGDDARFVMLTGGETANVLGGRVAVDYVLPSLQDLRIAAQFESIIRDLDTDHADDTAVILELNYSLTTSVNLMLDYRVDLNRSMGGEDHAVYLTFVYYGE